MTEDVQMKDANAEPEKKEETTEKKEPVDQFFELKKVLILMEKGANEKDFRTCASLTK